MTLITPKIAMPNICKAVISPKKPAAPLPALKFLPTITNPFASAKSAMDQMKNQMIVIKEST